MQDFESAVWADHRGQWTATLSAAFRALADGYDRLQRRSFAAPWAGTAGARHPAR